MALKQKCLRGIFDLKKNIQYFALGIPDLISVQNKMDLKVHKH
jgi:hypothetical protein